MKWHTSRSLVILCRIPTHENGTGRRRKHNQHPTLAVQLGDALRKAAEFWEAVEDAPTDIRRLSRELRLLGNVLNAIKIEHESGLIDVAYESTIREALDLAGDDINELAALVSGLARRLGNSNGRVKKQWRKVQMVLKADKIAKLKENLESVERILILLQMSRNQSMFQMTGKLKVIDATCQSSIQDSSNTTGASDLSESGKTMDIHTPKYISRRTTAKTIRVQTTRTSFNAGIGMVRLRSITSECEPKASETPEAAKYYRKKTFIIELALCFTSCRKEFRLKTDDSFDNWTFNTIRRRRNSDEVFQLCENGDAEGVRELIVTGQASVFDVDECGDSLLHYACKFVTPQLCQVLLDHGADVDLTNDQDRVPLTNLGLGHDPSRFENLIEPMTDIHVAVRSTDPRQILFELAGVYHLFLVHYPCRITPTVVQHFLRQRLYHFPFHRRMWLVTNMLDKIQTSVTVDGKAVDLLLGEYQSLLQRRYMDCWRLLPRFVSQWLVYLIHSQLNKQERLDIEFKIRRVLTLTKDLFLVSNSGTILDQIASYHSGDEDVRNLIIQKWLGLLSDSGVDLHTYGRFEQDNHPYGVIKQKRPCCRTITIELIYGQTPGSLCIKARDTVDPRYAALDPTYLCESGRRRRQCLSEVDEFLIKDGAPRATLPGSWEAPLKPNSELHLNGRIGEGFVYCLEPEWPSYPITPHFKETLMDRVEGCDNV